MTEETGRVQTEREQNTDEDVERERGRRIKGTIRSCRSDESEREECKC